ncbi:MAG TPA: ribosome biogenesis GTPase Der [Spirochaetia bacterium]|nr:ribosome biogenesis GTPase Der [Spirochaetales bacterium]HRS64737.1 ribosome biogenesis GTPase Der [Spirochaetia bacterium]HOT58103.1 ribosome biogenesis GTPase Der [Spirochaetales bacterium]HPD80246.1 ribosome biogenesis GTPase Der [Spirochaetales bacterium]HQK34218.1 ribosome biogenesis GTPase Der [Spirochaetales bacterium]
MNKHTDSTPETDSSAPKRWKNLPLVVIAGRPNVGKSTLFNRILGRRKAIVDPTPGVTRDPIEDYWYPHGCEMPVQLIDTGGLRLDPDALDRLVAEKSWEFIKKADVVLFLVDAANITPEDEEFAEKLRKYANKLILVVNKVDAPERESMAWNFARWGFPAMVPISAEHARNIDELEEAILCRLDWSHAQPEVEEQKSIKLAIMGKPNVGKSTLLNRLLGVQKSIVSDIPGTTRDVIEGQFHYRDYEITILDTAGIRKKSKVTESVEYYSVNRSIKTIEQSDIVLLLIDSIEGLSDQDKKITELAVEKGRPVIFVLNKWDKMPAIGNAFNAAKDKLYYNFGQMAYAPVLNISAKEGKGIEKLLEMVIKIYKELTTRIETSRLNRAVREWVQNNPPPISKGVRFKLRYAVQTGVNPVQFTFFITKPELVSETYKQFIKNKIRSELGLSHIPILMNLKPSRKQFEALE